MSRASEHLKPSTLRCELYWQIGAHIRCKIAAAEWGDGVVDRLAAHIARVHPGLRGLTRPNLCRMRQFYEAYVDAGEKVSALLRQIPWSCPRRGPALALELRD